LRHTWATLALQAGVHPKVVQERLGPRRDQHYSRYLQSRRACDGDRRRRQGGGTDLRCSGSLTPVPKAERLRAGCLGAVRVQDAEREAARALRLGGTNTSAGGDRHGRRLSAARKPERRSLLLRGVASDAD
jgi:hypothetical protein